MTSEPRLTFREIVTCDDPAFPPYLDLYETAFPANERIPVSSFVEAVVSAQREGPGEAHLLAALDEQERLAGMAYYEVKGEVGYLIYLAIVEERRGQSLGSRMFREIVRRLEAEPNPVHALLFEVDDPNNHDDAERHVAERRIRFYRRLGAQILRGIRYLQRVPNYPAVPMHLMFRPLAALSPEAAYEIARTFFGDEVTRTGEPLALD